MQIFRNYATTIHTYDWAVSSGQIHIEGVKT